MNIILAKPRGFCAGVTRAIETVEKAIAKFHAKQLKINNGNIELADAMVRIYQHNFLIRITKAL